MIILTFTDFNYLDIFNLFYHNLKKLRLDRNLLVVCLDIQTHKNLKKRGIKTIHKPYKINYKSKFWEFRLNTINQIFKKFKQDIIHTDSDCFWFKNIVNYIYANNNDLDMIGSIAFGHPKDIVAKMGFILCCGFYYIKYTDKNSVLLDKIIEDTSINSSDDQARFNSYIYKNQKNIVDHTMDDFIFKKIILNDETKVGIINDAIISRKPRQNLYCFHPYLSSNNIIEKKKQLTAALKMIK
jgi:hypothetical protein